MTYTLNDRPIILKDQCGGTTKAGRRCARRGYDVLRKGFWCPAHGTVNGPHPPISESSAMSNEGEQ